MSSLVWFLLLSYSSFVISHEQTGQPKSIFLLAGQSNMAGRGGVKGFVQWDGYIPPESQPNPCILRLSANLTWEEAKEPLHKDIDVAKVCGIGPAMSFARTLLEKNASDIGTVGLVPCAVGGTNISLWERDAYDGGTLYHQLIHRARAAVECGGVIRAMLWYQGEADSNNPDDAKLYKGRLEKFFADVRSDLELPTLPIIQVALASGYEYKDVVRKAQLEIDVPNMRTVDALGMEIGGDGLHLTTKAEVELGRMLADTFLEMSC